MAWGGGYWGGDAWWGAQQTWSQQAWGPQQGPWQEQPQQAWQGQWQQGQQQQTWQGQQPQEWQQQPVGPRKVPPRQEIKKKELRFDLNDRVVCNLGIRWIGAHIVGTDPHERDGWCYLAKTDNHPGLQSRTISVPSDTEHVCFQEVCFVPDQAELTKGAAPSAPASKLRYVIGDRVTCRVRHGTDHLENWSSGQVESVNFPLSGDLNWGEDDISGTYPSSVAYRVKLDTGKFVLCHADNYTLIRREGLEPQTRVKGVSKRMEDRKLPDGTAVRFDHMTERQKRLEPDEPEADSVLTSAQKKALFLE